MFLLILLSLAALWLIWELFRMKKRIEKLREKEKE